MNLELLIEAERRGILPPEKAELLAEARRRGLVDGAGPKPSAPPNANPGVDPSAPPEMVFNPSTGQYTSRELLTNHMLQNEMPQTTAAGATVMGAGRGASLGGVDELTGAVNAAIPGEGTMPERYTFGREYARASEDAGYATNPDDMITSEIAGALSLPIGALGQGGKMPARIGGSALTGAGMGGAYSAFTGEGVDERLDRMTTGAALGAGIGAVTPLAGAGIQKYLDARAGKKAINAAVRSAPSSDDLRSIGRAGYQAVDDAGVRLNPSSVNNKTSEIARILADEGSDPILTPNANRVSQRLTEMADGTNQSIPFSEMDRMRRIAGNAAGANPANKPDTRLASIAREKIDDYVMNLAPDDVDAGDIQALQSALPKAREVWGRMSRSQILDDAIDASDNYLSGKASGMRNQFRNILTGIQKGKVKGFSDAEVKMLRRVANGTMPEQIVNYLGSGLGMMAQMGAGGAVGALGGPAGIAVGAGAGAGTAALSRRFAERIVGKNAEIARALVASGKVQQLPKNVSPEVRAITETLLRRGGPVGVQ